MSIPTNKIAEAYISVADELVRRIELLAVDYPEILASKNAWDLFDYGLKCDDLQPSYFQASWALAKVQSAHRA